MKDKFRYSLVLAIIAVPSSCHSGVEKEINVFYVPGDMSTISKIPCSIFEDEFEEIMQIMEVSDSDLPPRLGPLVLRI